MPYGVTAPNPVTTTRRIITSPLRCLELDCHPLSRWASPQLSRLTIPEISFPLFLSSKKDPQVPEHSTQSAAPSASVQARCPGEPCGQGGLLRPAMLGRGFRAADACAAADDVDEDDGGPDQQVAAAGSRNDDAKDDSHNWQVGDRRGSGWTLVGDQPGVQHAGRAGSRHQGCRRQQGRGPELDWLQAGDGRGQLASAFHEWWVGLLGGWPWALVVAVWSRRAVSAVTGGSLSG
jgi:hypothetical protein